MNKVSYQINKPLRFFTRDTFLKLFLLKVHT